MITRLTIKPISSAILCGVLCLGTAAFAQDTNNTTGNAQTKQVSSGGSGADQYPDLFEIDPFGGVSTYGTVARGLQTKLVDGGLAGLRLAWNPAHYFGIELWGDYDVANVEFKTSSGVYPPGYGAAAGSPLPKYSFGSRNWFFGLNPVIPLKPRGSKVQPYLTVGVNGIQFSPTSKAYNQARLARNVALYNSGQLNNNLQVGLNYGGGVKFHMSDHLGLRIDARGFWSRNPTYGLPNYPNGGIYIPSKDHINGFQGSVGLVFFAGSPVCPPMPAAPPPPAPLPTPAITGGEGTTCPGKAVTLHASLPGVAADRKLKYAWTVNGQAQGEDSPDFTYTPNGPSTANIEVTVTDTTPPPPPMEKPKKFPQRCWVPPPAPQPPAPVNASVSITPNTAGPTISSVTADQPTLTCAAVQNGTHTTNLTAQATAGPCGGNLTYKWTVSEGTVTNDSTPTATFDASSLNFEGGAQNQTKTVTATVTVTDQNGQTASQTTTITVNCPPQFVRLDDVVFAKNNARVNNCGKRILIDQAAQQAAGGDYDILLVGHRADSEKANLAGKPPRGKAARGPALENGMPLDEARALNSAAVLSGGGATCGSVDPSRIKLEWVGTDQTSDRKPGLCGTSNIKERRGQATTQADQDQRVEVYLIPHGSNALPPGVKEIQPTPDILKALGCPK